MRGRWVCRIERRGSEVVLGYAGGRMGSEDFAPTNIGIEKAPPDSILAHLLHASASVEKGSEHPLSQLNDAHILFRLGRLGGIVGYAVLLGNRWYDEGRVQADQCLPQGCEFGVSPTHLELAGANGVCDEAAASFSILPRMDNLDFQLRVLVKYLLYPAGVSTFLGLYLGRLAPVIVQLFVTEVGGSRDKVGCVLRRRAT